MNTGTEILIFLALGVVGHLIFFTCLKVQWKFHLFVLRHRFNLLLNNRGEVGDDRGGDDKGGGEIKFTPEQQKFLDKTIDKKYAAWKAEEKAKYGDYDDLRKFREEQLKLQDSKQQEELEKSKKYDEAKQSYESKLKERDAIISKKEQEVNDLKITHVLTNEINRLNGYSEETLALIKNQAMLDAKGNVVMKIIDADGLEKNITAAEGIKKLLESRPYLVKSTHKAGSGTGTGSSGESEAGAGTGNEDLSSLNSAYSKAFYAGDLKKAREIKAKIQTKLATH